MWLQESISDSSKQRNYRIKYKQILLPICHQITRANLVRFLSTIWHQIAKYRSYSISVANLIIKLQCTSLIRFLLLICYNNSVQIRFLLLTFYQIIIAGFITFLLTFCIVWYNRFCIQSAIFLLVIICSRQLTKSVRTDLTD